MREQGARSVATTIEDLHEGMGLAITTERLQMSGNKRYVCPQAQVAVA